MWHPFLIPALRRGRPHIPGQPGLHSEILSQNKSQITTSEHLPSRHDLYNIHAERQSPECFPFLWSERWNDRITLTTFLLAWWGWFVWIAMWFLEWLRCRHITQLLWKNIWKPVNDRCSASETSLSEEDGVSWLPYVLCKCKWQPQSDMHTLRSLSAFSSCFVVF